LPEINRRWCDLNERRRRLWSRIAAMPARTVEGMHAKIAFASSFDLLERGDLVEGTMEDLLLSAAMDYANIHGQEALMNGPDNRRSRIYSAVLKVAGAA
jgi:hypothetical protein